MRLTFWIVQVLHSTSSEGLAVGDELALQLASRALPGQVEAVALCSRAVPGWS